MSKTVINWVMLVGGGVFTVWLLCRDLTAVDYARGLFLLSLCVILHMVTQAYDSGVRDGRKERRQ